MYMLSKHLRCPSLHRESKHLGILEAAVQAMAESLREGQDTRIIKVKSHIGINGKEEADRLAHDACVRMNCHQQVLEGLPVREHIHWPVQAQPKIGSSLAGHAQPCLVPQRHPSGLPAKGTPAPCEEDVFVPEQQVNNLRKEMKALIRPILATGYAKRTIYREAWKAANAYVLGDISNHFWKSAIMPVVTQVLKYRFGQLWNMKLAFLQRRTYLPGFAMSRSDRCPHCHEPKSGGHIMGGCGHRVMKSLYISRHDGALRQVLKAINQGRHGSYLKIADVGRYELTNDLGVISKRVPDWLVSNEILQE